MTPEEQEQIVERATAAQRASFFAGRFEEALRVIADMLETGCCDKDLRGRAQSLVDDPWPAAELALLEHNARLQTLTKDQRAALKRANAALVGNGLPAIPFTRTPS